MAWVVIFISAKALKLERFGFEIKAYSLVYKNKGVKIYSVDSSTDIGLRVTGLGGIVSLLRYSLET